MSDTEEQLSTLSSGQDWALDGADDFATAAEAVQQGCAARHHRRRRVAQAGSDLVS